MSNTYTNISDVCSQFYDLVITPSEVAKFVYSQVKDFEPKNGLFKGSSDQREIPINASFDIDPLCMNLYLFMNK